MASSPATSLTGRIAAREGGPIVAVDLDRCQVFFAYVRIHGYAMVAECERLPELELRNNLRAAFELGGAQPVQRCRILSIQPNHAVEFELEVLGETGADIDAAFLVVSFATGTSRFPMRDVLPYSRARDVTTQIPQFKDLIRQAAATGTRPRLLDIGGRARSRIQKSLDYPDCDVTVFDIIPDPGVDVVGDAHELSRHFPPASFDFAMSLAVFEHLLMPWKVAVEMSRVMKPGGVCLIWAPHTHAIHDVPWDFFRFSDQAWHALFNRRTGWEVIATDMSYMVHVVPAVHPSSPAYAEVTHGYMSCGVMARCIGPSEVDWPVALTEVIDTTYPTFPDEEAAHG
jgi:SAM-dependent methyltransferase